VSRLFKQSSLSLPGRARLVCKERAGSNRVSLLFVHVEAGNGQSALVSAVGAFAAAVGAVGNSAVTVLSQQAKNSQRRRNKRRKLAQAKAKAKVAARLGGQR